MTVTKVIRYINLNLYFLSCMAAIYFLIVSLAVGYGVEFYSKDEHPFGISYSDWVAKFWNWDFSIPIDSQTNTLAGLKDNGCLMHKDNSMVMLVDTAAGGIWKQKCTISRTEGILIPIWTGECDQALKGFDSYSFKQLSECARAYDLGIVKGQVKVDDTPVATLDAIDYKTNVMNNVTEIYTKQFNAIVPKESHLISERYGTFPAAAHGWFVFLKPLQPGNHVVYYQNSVEATTLSGAGNMNSGQFTYYLNVK
jgi:hypothetical protein